MRKDIFIPTNIRYIRNRLGLSIKQLAEKLQMKRGNIDCYETKGILPPWEYLLALKELSGCSLHTIITINLLKNPHAYDQTTV